MIQISQCVKIVLSLFVIVAFNGCAETSIQYITVPCKVEKPQRKAPIYSCSARYSDDFEYSKCVAEKSLLLEGDYQALSVAFDGCTN